MRHRNSSRLLVLDSNNKVLLFRFVQKHKEPTCCTFWATPGGEIEVGESAEQAAKRELYEETGYDVSIDTLGKPIWHSESVFQMNNGEDVMAQECFFVVRIASAATLSCTNWTEQEHEVISEYKWWSIEQLKAKDANEIIFPENLVELLEEYAPSFLLDNGVKYQLLSG